jgi:hypothetical protein
MCCRNTRLRTRRVGLLGDELRVHCLKRAQRTQRTHATHAMSGRPRMPRIPFPARRHSREQNTCASGVQVRQCYSRLRFRLCVSLSNRVRSLRHSPYLFRHLHSALLALVFILICSCSRRHYFIFHGGRPRCCPCGGRRQPRCWNDITQCPEGVSPDGQLLCSR